ncbi:GNAT family N-acetyltransferase [Planctomycetota bacterium]
MILSTPRLFLRQVTQGDAVSIHAYRSLPEVARLQSWSNYEMSDAEDLVSGQTTVALDALGSWFQLAIIQRSTNTLIGDCGIHFPANAPRQVELGITLDPNHQRQGIASEAMRSVIMHLFGYMKKQCVVAVVDAKNDSAIGLFDNLGFRRQSTERVWFKGSWGEEITFAVHANEWQ